jgi:uncharacterized protein YecE (DUF72 family)
MKIYIGTSGYSYKEWKGKFYPNKIAFGDMLRFYAERLGTVEINNTFYRMPTTNVLMSWTMQVPNNFIFAFKAPRVITHLKRLCNVGEETQYLFRTLAVLHNKLGPILFQFPKNFKADQMLMEDFLSLVPAQMLCAFEFRNTSWLNDEILGMLKKKGFSICTTDTNDNPSKEIMSTASWGYLRLRRSDYTDDDLARWMERISSQRWKMAFIFFKHEDRAIGAELAIHLQRLMKA